MQEQTNYELLQSNKEKTKSTIKSYLDTGEPADINPSVALERAKAEFRGFDYAKAIDALEERRDNLNNISRNIIDGQLIRDARNAKPTPEPENATSFAIQYLNISQAAELLLKNAEDKGEISLQEANKARAEIRLAAGTILNKLNTEKSVDPDEVRYHNNALVSILERVKATDGTNFFNKKTLIKDLTFAKEIVQLDMPCYHVSTISSAKDRNNKIFTVVESEVMFLGLTEAQKGQFKRIADGNGAGIDWYDGLSSTKQELLKRYASTIAKGSHVIPTQLIDSVPLLRNAYTKITSIAEEGNSLKVLIEDNHSGTPTFHGKGDRLQLSKETVEQAKSISGAEDLGLTSLNSSADFLEKDADIVSISQELAKTMDGVSAVIAPINSRRGFSRDNIDKECNEILGKVADVAQRLGLENTQKFLSGNKKYKKAALEELENSGRDISLIADFKTAIEAKDRVNKRSWGIWSLFGTGSENQILDIVSRISIISYSMNKGSLKEFAKEAGISVPERIVYCKSGKDRTGLVEIHTSHLAVSKYLSIDPESSIAKENLVSLVNAGHTQTIASVQGGSRGCFGILTSSKRHIPNIYPKSLMSVTANFNKLKIKTDLLFRMKELFKKISSFLSSSQSADDKQKSVMSEPLLRGEHHEQLKKTVSEQAISPVTGVRPSGVPTTSSVKPRSRSFHK